MKDQPNILLITSDAHRAECYGFETAGIKTPHIDILQRQGTRFSRCFTPHVLCQPARASILTGLYPLTHGVYDNGIDLPEEIGGAGFGGQFAKAGYLTGFVGKAHLASRRTFRPTGTPGNQHLPSPYDEHWCGPYMGFDHVELAVNGHNLTAPNEPPVGRQYESWFYGDGLGAEKNRLHKIRLPPDCGAPLVWNSALPPAWQTSAWVADRTIGLLQRSEGQPFCIWASFPDPHPPFDCPAPWCFTHSADDVVLPRHRTLDLDRRPWWHEAALREPCRIYDDPRLPDDKRHAGFSRVAPETDVQLRHMLANYYGMISLFDHNVGRIMTALHQFGLDDDTLILLTSDHGFYMGDHGLLLQNPMMYEALVRVGLIARGPGIPAGRIVDDPVSTTDVAATMYDYGGLGSDIHNHGRSLRPVIESRDGGRDFAYLEWDVEATRYCIGQELRLRMVRTRQHKLTLELNSGAGELYDLAEDGDEMDNLFDNPSHADVRRRLERMIHDRPADQLEPKLMRVGYY